MRTFAICVILSVLFTSSLLAQSDSFLALKNKFSDSEDVYCFSTNGFLARTVLWMAGEHEFTDAVKHIDRIRLIVVPKASFRSKGVTLAGFRHILNEDSFEELANVKDHGDNVSLYLKSTPRRDNRYMVLVEQPDEVVVIEIQGYIDPNLILNHEALSFNSN